MPQPHRQPKTLREPKIRIWARTSILQAHLWSSSSWPYFKGRANCPPLTQHLSTPSQAVPLSVPAPSPSLQPPFTFKTQSSRGYVGYGPVTYFFSIYLVKTRSQHLGSKFLAGFVPHHFLWLENISSVTDVRSQIAVRSKHCPEWVPTWCYQELTAYSL